MDKAYFEGIDKEETKILADDLYTHAMITKLH